MPNIGLVADGLYDQRVIAILLRECGQGITVVPRQCGGGQAIGKDCKAIRILRELDRPGLVDFAIWATDSETDDPRRIEVRMRSAVKGASLNFRVCCVPVVRMMEAWLVADEVAVHRICGASIKFSSPETLANPKAELRHILGRRPYTAAIAERIAEAADVETIARRCPSFRKLRDCLAETGQPHRKIGGAVRKKRTKRRAPTTSKRPPNT
jgi:hypothetical protein